MILKNSIKIIIKSVKNKLLIIYCHFLLNLIKKLNLKVLLINVPTKRKEITLLKSPHVYKKAREQFNLNIYKRVLIINTLNSKSVVNKIHLLLLNRPKFIKIGVTFFL